jgi:hypothetical protein
MGCYRIRFSDLAVVECGARNSVPSKAKFPEAVKVAKLFKKNGNLELIRDGKFLAGGFSQGDDSDKPRDGKVTGKRIDVLPDGTKLSKGFPLFGSELVIHDEKSHGHWDVIFKNPSGSFNYLYSLDKIKLSKDKKFKLVGDFEKCLPRLKKNLLREISFKGEAGGGRREAVGGGRRDDLVLAMLVLLKTKMRVGSEIYYKRSRHKGLTTLKKKDVKISGNKVRFDFIGKDGVPQSIEEVFGERVISGLKQILKKRKQDDFIFLNANGKVFRDTDFEACFERFCGKRFYPHIVRSHFATREVEAFLRKVEGGRRKAEGGTKKFCLKLAGKLGHKKFSKKNGEWEESYEVTLHHYVRPDLVERIVKLI